MKRLSHTDIDRLTSELASFARCGVPMNEGLRQLRDSLPYGELKKQVANLADAVEKGTSLSAAMLETGGAVPGELAALIACGERGGDMQSMLDFSVEHSRRIRQYRSAFVTMLVYPLAVVVVLLLVSLFMISVIFPKLIAIFNSMGLAIPGMSSKTLGIMEFMTSPAGWIILLIAAIVIVAMVIALVRSRNRAIILSHLPGISSLVALSDTAILMKYIGIMTAGGVPLPESCRAASLAVSDMNTAASLKQMGDASEQGHPVANLMSGSVPGVAAWLFDQGEKRGALPDACDGIARYCETQFDLLSRRALAILEPLLILLLTVVAGGLVLMFYLPLFEIPKLLGRY